jgi:amino acid transporter
MLISERPVKERKEPVLFSEGYVRETMPPTLRTFDLTMIFVMIMFFINNPVGTIGSGAVAFIYWILGALVFFIPCVVAAAQLGAMFPHEGSTYNWTHKALGGFWSLFASVSFWVPGLLGMVAGAGIGVTFIQGLNSQWLTLPWQQGLLIIAMLVFSAFLSVQRLSMVKYVVNIMTALTLGVVVLLGLAALFWLATGHHSATSFTHGSDWAITPGNFALSGAVILAYLGADVSLIMGGEITDRKVPVRHLAWGGPIIIVGYMIVTFGLLVIEGPNAANMGPFSVISAIQQVFGKFVSNVAAVCIIGYFPIFVTVLNTAFARLLMATSIDRRLPIGLSKLNKHRAPANAVVFQTVVAVVFVAIAFMLPYIVPLGRPADLSNEVFGVSLAALTLVWAVSTSFLFIDLLVLYIRDRAAFHQRRIVPMPVLWWCIIVAPLACVLAIIVTLDYSQVPQISNENWRYIVGGLTLICLVAAAVGSMFATSEAAWQDQTNEMEHF